MKRLVLCLSVTFALGISCFSQTTLSEWMRADRTDSTTGNKFVEFKLEGRFLSPPEGDDNEAPFLLLRCVPGERTVGGGNYVSGSLIDAHVHVGATLNHRPNGLPVSYRLDDGKPRNSLWDRSSDGTAAFLPNQEVNTLFYSRATQRKSDSGQAVKRVVLSVDQYLAGNVVIEFDLPEQESTYDSCGLIKHHR
jgi:hypothetical protein